MFGYTQVLRAACTSVLLCASASAGAEENFEVSWLGECSASKVNDPSLLPKKTVPPGADCEAAHGTNLRIVDTRVGVEWSIRQPTSPASPAKPITATGDPLESSSHKACVRAHPPNGDIIDEWIVPNHVSCNGRSAESPFFRRYRDGKVCLMPNNMCIEVEKLDTKGKAAVSKSIAKTLATRK